MARSARASSPAGTSSNPMHEAPSELDILFREHTHISASLLENRRKGATRFNLYVAIVGIALAGFGFRDGVAEGREIWAISAGFAFLAALGWLMLITLIRRSITTDLHLEALQSVRNRFLHHHEALGRVIPTVHLWENGDSGAFAGAGFERAKLRYYKDPRSRKPSLWPILGYLLRQSRRSIFPHYGDLIENICAINSFVVALGITWLAHPVLLQAGAAIPLVIAFVLACIWLWYAQMMYVWYKHTANALFTRDDAQASEDDLQERSSEGDDAGTTSDRRYVQRFRRAILVLLATGLAVVALVEVLVWFGCLALRPA